MHELLHGVVNAHVLYLPMLAPWRCKHLVILPANEGTRLSLLLYCFEISMMRRLNTGKVSVFFGRAEPSQARPGRANTVKKKLLPPPPRRLLHKFVVVSEGESTQGVQGCANPCPSFSIIKGVFLECLKAFQGLTTHRRLTVWGTVF